MNRFNNNDDRNRLAGLKGKCIRTSCLILALTLSFTCSHQAIALGYTVDVFDLSGTGLGKLYSAPLQHSFILRKELTQSGAGLQTGFVYTITPTTRSRYFGPQRFAGTQPESKIRSFTLKESRQQKALAQPEPEHTEKEVTKKKKRHFWKKDKEKEKETAPAMHFSNPYEEPEACPVIIPDFPSPLLEPVDMTITVDADTASDLPDSYCYLTVNVNQATENLVTNHALSISSMPDDFILAWLEMETGQGRFGTNDYQTGLLLGQSFEQLAKVIEKQKLLWQENFSDQVLGLDCNWTINAIYTDSPNGNTQVLLGFQVILPASQEQQAAGAEPLANLFIQVTPHELSPNQQAHATTHLAIPPQTPQPQSASVNTGHLPHSLAQSEPVNIVRTRRNSQSQYENVVKSTSSGRGTSSSSSKTPPSFRIEDTMSSSPRKAKGISRTSSELSGICDFSPNPSVGSLSDGNSFLLPFPEATQEHENGKPRSSRPRLSPDYENSGIIIQPLSYPETPPPPVPPKKRKYTFMEQLEYEQKKLEWQQEAHSREQSYLQELELFKKLSPYDSDKPSPTDKRDFDDDFYPRDGGGGALKLQLSPVNY